MQPSDKARSPGWVKRELELPEGTPLHEAMEQLRSVYEVPNQNKIVVTNFRGVTTAEWWQKEKYDDFEYVIE